MMLELKVYEFRNGDNDEMDPALFYNKIRVSKGH